jgi:hypothetical protein
LGVVASVAKMTRIHILEQMEQILHSQQSQALALAVERY